MSTPTNELAGRLTAIRAEIEACVHCGFCLPTCPTYAELGTEMDSPRGRLYLIRALQEARIGPTESVLRHLDRCLDCRACETVCPSGVEYGHILEHTRAVLEPMRRRSRVSRFVRWIALQQILPHPARLGRARQALEVYQRSPIPAWMRRLGWSRVLPAALQRAEALAPQIRGAPFAAGRALRFDPVGRPRGLVGFFTGCIMDQTMGDTHRASVRLLTRHGYAVLVVPDQTCCGALHVHNGDLSTARRLLIQNARAFEHAGVEGVIVNSAGCGAQLRDADRLFRLGTASHDRGFRPAHSIDPDAGEQSPAQWIDPGADQRSPAQSIDLGAGERSPAHSIDPDAGEQSPAHSIDPAAAERSPAHSIDPAAAERSPAYSIDRGGAERSQTQSRELEAIEWLSARSVDLTQFLVEIGFQPPIDNPVAPLPPSGSEKRNRPTTEQRSQLTHRPTSRLGVERIADTRIGPGAGKAHRRVVYDAPCHLHHAQRVNEAPLQLLQALPGVELLPLPESDMCCGAAGIYNLLQPSLSTRLLGRKVDHILASGADTVVTANPGCMIQLEAGLRAHGSHIDVQHIADFLDAAYAESSVTNQEE